MFVSQKVIVRNSEGKLLALRRSATDTNRPLTWDLPGGQLEEGEQLEESARREIREETGIEVGDLTLIDADARAAHNGEYWVVLFSLSDALSDHVVLSYEHDRHEWLTREEFLERKSSDRIRDLFQKHGEL